MPAQWEDKFVKCPFYKKTSANEIVCEGVCAKSSIHLTFESRTTKKTFMKERCFEIDGAKKCPIYTVITRKYEE